MKLTNKQIGLGAKYLAASNTGLLGCGFPEPTTEAEIEGVYSRISYEYECNLGEGLEEELDMWKEDLQKPKNDFIPLLQKKVPFIFEGK